MKYQTTMSTWDIKLHLAKVFSFVVNALEGELKDIVEKKCFISGNSIASLYFKQNVNDYDFYFLDENSANTFKKTIKETLSGKKNARFSNVNKLKFDFKHESDNALSFDIIPDVGENIKVQFITKFFGPPSQVVKNFDFHHCMNYFYPQRYELIFNAQNTTGRELKFNISSPYPIAALKRMNKFISRGWSITDDELLKIGLAINSLEMTSASDIKEQIHGLYSKKKSSEILNTMKDLKSTRFGKKLDDIINEDEVCERCPETDSLQF